MMKESSGCSRESRRTWHRDSRTSLRLQPPSFIPRSTPHAATFKLLRSLLLGRIYHVGLTILRRIADYFVQNRRFFLQESQIFLAGIADFLYLRHAPSLRLLTNSGWVPSEGTFASCGIYAACLVFFLMPADTPLMIIAGLRVSVYQYKPSRRRILGNGCPKIRWAGGELLRRAYTLSAWF